uniref:Uncharacterized protein n=1 Tax=Anguilla anguilla TaxID=7936 RepID=A0A0E9V4A7_ANGAN
MCTVSKPGTVRSYLTFLSIFLFCLKNRNKLGFISGS